MKIVRWLIILLVAAVLVVFAISNRQSVDVTFWPLPVTIESPLFLVVLGSAALAFLIGQFVAWLAAQRWRHELRVKQRQIEALERELASTQAQLKPNDVLIEPSGQTRALR